MTDELHMSTDASSAPTNAQSAPTNAQSAPTNESSAATNKRSGRANEPIDTAITRELDLNESIGLAAKRSDYTHALSDAAIAPTTIDAFLLRNTNTRNLFAQSVSDRATRATLTRTEAEQRKVVLTFTRRVQAAALQKYDADPSQRPRLADYYIGAGRTLSRATLAQYTEGILQRLATDTLPGISADTIAAFATARQTWIATNDAQGAAGQAALAHRAEGKAELEQTRAVRLSIQYAIEARYPHTDPASAPARAAFHLPPQRPFRAPARR